ncbi:hypothetical protein [Streptomyces sp. NPDC058157]|uniref:hypothetical protein n=1 Tax=Streptomyces sp. NPDC058157 TaxID=3346360 RepID=UPI0036EAA854
MPGRGAKAVRWDDLVEEFGFSAAEREEVDRGAAEMIAVVRAHRPAEVRKRQHPTQVQVAEFGDEQYVLG